MAVPSTFADLSATPASNSGLISESSAVNVIDNHFQTIYAFMASVYANSGNGWASPYLTAASPSYTGAMTGAAGSVTSPAYSFTSDTNTGIYLPSADALAITTGGTQRVEVQSTGRVFLRNGTATEASDLSTSVVNAAFVMQPYTASTWTLAAGSAAGSVMYLQNVSADGTSVGNGLSFQPYGGAVGVGTLAPAASALLDVQSTTKGLRLPNMTTTQKNAIGSPAAGLMVFDTTLGKACVHTGSAWQTITSA
jgi:hypothetical protein